MVNGEIVVRLVYASPEDAALLANAAADLAWLLAENARLRSGVVPTPE